jgi:hypothetical protein
MEKALSSIVAVFEPTINLRAADADISVYFRD